MNAIETRNRIAFVAALFMATMLLTLVIGELRGPLYTAWENIWIWWANGPSHYFLRPWQ